jgi:hypothetical protein
MAHTFRTFMSMLARDPIADDAHVHFHRGPQGQPAACHDPKCPAPRLTV